MESLYLLVMNDGIRLWLKYMLNEENNFLVRRFYFWNWWIDLMIVEVVVSRVGGIFLFFMRKIVLVGGLWNVVFRLVGFKGMRIYFLGF